MAYLLKVCHNPMASPKVLSRKSFKGQEVYVSMLDWDPSSCFCVGHNIEMKDGDSPWHNRHQNGHLDNKKAFPFGCLIQFLPQPDYATTLPKFGPKGVPGVFLGYHALPGQRWSGSYLACALDDLRDIDNKPKIQHVKRVKEDGFGTLVEINEWIFPCKARYDRLRKTIPVDNEAALDALELHESIWDPSRLGLSASEVAENAIKFPKKRAKTRTPKAKAKSNADIPSVSDHPVADATEVDPDTLVDLIITDPLFSDKENEACEKEDALVDGVGPTHGGTDLSPAKTSASSEQSAPSASAVLARSLAGRSSDKGKTLTVKVDGERAHRKVLSLLDGPEGHPVYFVPGGTVVGGIFTRQKSNSCRAPHVTGQEWARMDEIEKLAAAVMWDEKNPNNMVRIAGVAKQPGSIPAAPAEPSSVMLEEDIPVMPVRSSSSKHRTKNDIDARTYKCAVARPVGEQELLNSPKAKAALQLESGAS